MIEASILTHDGAHQESVSGTSGVELVPILSPHQIHLIAYHRCTRLLPIVEERRLVKGLGDIFIAVEAIRDGWVPYTVYVHESSST